METVLPFHEYQPGLEDVSDAYHEVPDRSERTKRIQQMEADGEKSAKAKGLFYPLEKKSSQEKKESNEARRAYYEYNRKNAVEASVLVLDTKSLQTAFELIPNDGSDVLVVSFFNTALQDFDGGIMTPALNLHPSIDCLFREKGITLSVCGAGSVSVAKVEADNVFIANTFVKAVDVKYYVPRKAFKSILADIDTDNQALRIIKPADAEKLVFVTSDRFGKGTSSHNTEIVLQEEPSPTSSMCPMLLNIPLLDDISHGIKCNDEIAAIRIDPTFMKKFLLNCKGTIQAEHKKGDTDKLGDTVVRFRLYQKDKDAFLVIQAYGGVSSALDRTCKLGLSPFKSTGMKFELENGKQMLFLTTDIKVIDDYIKVKDKEKTEAVSSAFDFLSDIKKPSVHKLHQMDMLAEATLTFAVAEMIFCPTKGRGKFDPVGESQQSTFLYISYRSKSNDNILASPFIVRVKNDAEDSKNNQRYVVASLCLALDDDEKITSIPDVTQSCMWEQNVNLMAFKE
jgi:hypothetical protein